MAQWPCWKEEKGGGGNEKRRLVQRPTGSSHGTVAMIKPHALLICLLFCFLDLPEVFLKGNRLLIEGIK